MDWDKAGWFVFWDIITIIAAVMIVGGLVWIFFGYENVQWTAIFIGACIGRAFGILMRGHNA